MASPPVVMLAPGVGCSKVEHQHAPELHDHEHQHQHQLERRGGAVTADRPDDVTQAVGPQQPPDPHQAEEPQDREEGRQAAQQVDPAALLDEVSASRMRQREVAEEVEQEDRGQRPLHEARDLLGALGHAGQVGDDHVDDRDHGQQADEDLVSRLRDGWRQSLQRPRAHGPRVTALCSLRDRIGDLPVPGRLLSGYAARGAIAVTGDTIAKAPRTSGASITLTLAWT